MTRHRLPRRWWLLVIVALVMIVGHGVLVRTLSRMPLPAIVVMAGIVLIVMAHFGVFGSAYARFRRRPRC
jgi:4-amino-4-deoxy-L-arabinose transferase-like glycosyltransferase